MGVAEEIKEVATAEGKNDDAGGLGGQGWRVGGEGRGVVVDRGCLRK